MSGSTSSVADDAVERFRAALDGDVIAPGDSGYDTARVPHFTGFDRRPALIARPRTSEAVAHVVAFAAEQGGGLAIRSGGHSVAGHSAPEGAVLLDLSHLKALDVDVDGRTASAQTGLTAGEYTAAVGEHGLATGFGDTGTVGLGGLTLGGGIGYLSRLYGLTIDDVLEAEVVTANAEVLQVDADHHPDLFWAIRGGGGNFGVATRFRYRLHEVPQVYGGALVLPSTPEALEGCMAAAAAAPEALSCILNVLPGALVDFLPEELKARPVLLVLICFVGPPEEGEAALAPFLEVAEPLVQMLQPMPYAALFEMDEGEEPPLVEVRTVFVDQVQPGDLAMLIERAPSAPGMMGAAQLRVLGGAVARVPAEATAFAHRDKPVMVTVGVFHESLADGSPAAAWVDDVMAALGDAGGDHPAYVGFLSDASDLRVRQSYPPTTLERLRKVKARYDPTNLFRYNHNIAP